MSGDDVDPWLPARLRAEALLLRYEALLEAAVRKAVETWLEAARRLVLGGGLTAAAGEEEVPPDIEAMPQAAPVWWAAVQELIAPVIADLFGERFLVTARTATISDLPYRESYLEEVFSRLKLFPAAQFEEIRPEILEALSEGEGIDQVRDRIAAVLDFDAARDAPGTRDHERTKRLRGRIRAIERRLEDAQLPLEEARALRAERSELYPQLYEAEQGWQWKARRIARTELLGAYNGGSHAGAVARAQVFDQVMVKRWLATRDTRVRDTHRLADGQLQPIGEPFLVGLGRLAHPGDPTAPPEEIINCRCTALYYDFDELSEEDQERVTSPASDPAAAAAITAAADQGDDMDDDKPTELPDGWEGILAPLGVRSGDGRMIDQPEGGLRMRQPPVPFLWQKELDYGHGGAVVVGRIDHAEIRTVEGQTVIWGRGPYDLGSEDGREASRLLHEGFANGVSVDLDDLTMSEVWYDQDGQVVDIEALGEDDFWELWDAGDITPVYTATDWRLMATTQVSQPAFDQARISPVYGYADKYGDDDEGLTASAAAAAVYAAADFDNPRLTGPTPLTVTDDGRVYGHLATWGTCHIAFPGTCVTPPKSVTDYALFHLGEVLTDAGPLAVGKITLGGGHAEPRAGMLAAIEHYDNAGTAVAVVRAGEDAHGIWLAGRLVDGVSPEQVEALMRSPLSGDWRRINSRPVSGNLELVAALAVNVPGFPIPRTLAASAAGGQLSLVAAGVLPRRRARRSTGRLDVKDFARRVAAEVAAIGRRRERADRLAARIGRDPRTRADQLAARIGRP